jgi:hypothetical protein
MITRRDFLAGSALAGGGLAVAGGLSMQFAATRELQPVVAFFDGQLWLDTSGVSVAYRAPTVARAMPSFTDEELIRARGYI